MPTVGTTGSGVHGGVPTVGTTGSGVHGGVPTVGTTGSGVHGGVPTVGTTGSGVHGGGAPVCCLTWAASPATGIGLPTDGLVAQITADATTDPDGLHTQTLVARRRNR